MKAKVIEFFQNLPKSKTEQFNKAFELYRQSPEKSIAAERVYNAAGYSESNLANLKYDLQKLHGIKDKEIVPVPVVPVVEEKEVENVGSSEPNNTGNNAGELEEQNKELQEQNEELLSENEDLQEQNEELQEKVEELEAEKEAKQSVNQTGLREEFPFLNDEDCPNELKILVADKITAWKKYQEAHVKIQIIESGKQEASAEELEELAKIATVNFEENQRIYKELNAYKETGKVLGEHPIFRTLQLQREVEEMTPEELVKYKAASAKYFTDNKKAREKAVEALDEKRILEIDDRVDARKEKLALVNKKLGISEK